MIKVEKKAVVSVATVYAFRMLGLFMILPVFALYADQLGSGGTSPILIGIAIGIYGLTQAAFQIPFGLLSDKYGRKPILLMGLLIFALGSIVAAQAETIYGIILGRALQGSGAIAAVLMALLSDLTSESFRLRAMAMVGMTIGLSFAAAMVLGPLLSDSIGVPGIFWVTAILAFSGILVVQFLVPVPKKLVFHRDTETVPGFIKPVLMNKQLLSLDFGIFIHHMILTACFIVIPFALRDYAGLESADHWMVYLPVILCSFILMVPFVIFAEKYHNMKLIYAISIAILLVSQLILGLFFDSMWGCVIALLVFFLAFNVLEALLPSFVVKFSPVDKKGTAMGMYSSCQFLGAFSGGVVGGLVFEMFDIVGVFGFCLVAALVWLIVAVLTSEPPYMSSFMIHIDDIDGVDYPRNQEIIAKMSGVGEVVIVPEENTIYMKIDKKKVNLEALESFCRVNMCLDKA